MKTDNIPLFSNYELRITNYEIKNKLFVWFVVKKLTTGY